VWCRRPLEDDVTEIDLALVCVFKTEPVRRVTVRVEVGEEVLRAESWRARFIEVVDLPTPPFRMTTLTARGSVLVAFMLSSR